MSRIRPFVLARHWGCEPYAALRLCLLAAWHGVLDLSWDLICPNCRGATARWAQLAEVTSAAHCEDCQIRFDADFDRAVEVTFRPNPRYRQVDEAIFCSGGPGNTPHIVAQTVLAAGAAVEWQLPLAPGRYRVRNLTASASGWIHVVGTEVAEGWGHSGAVKLEDGDSGEEATDSHVPLLQAGSVGLRVENRLAGRQQVILERVSSYEECATAALVTVFQEFRDLFSSQVLSPSTQLAIRTLPLLFTDLQGSTAMYRRLGNAAAYALVRDHFELLRSRIASHGGGVVKTIGDAVMAAFPTAADAVACALEIHRDLEAFNRTATEPLRLKLGIHQGPCIAVRSLDDRLDYFGSTVNLAARTHQVSTGADIVLTAEVRHDPQVEPLLVAVPEERITEDLRGIGSVELFRLRPR